MGDSIKDCITAATDQYTFLMGLQIINDSIQYHKKKLSGLKQILVSILDLLLFGNIFIGLCAVAQGLITFYLLLVPPLWLVLFILFTATMVIYNFGRLISKPFNPELSVFKQVRWFYANYNLMLIITIIEVAGLTIAFFFLANRSRLLLMILAPLSFLYGLPIFNGRRYGLRNVPGVKALLITIVWTLSCVIFPVIETNATHQGEVGIYDSFLLLLNRIFYIAALTIPFDIRDLLSDRSHGLKTLPVVFGKKRAYYFCVLLLVASLMPLIGLYVTVEIFASMAITAFCTGILAIYAERQNSEYYYYFWLDGTMTLPCILILLLRI